MPTLEDVKTALEKLDNGSSLYEVVVSSISAEKSRADTEKKRADTEKQRGMDEISKKNREAESLRKFKQGFESIGFDAEDNAELDDFVADIQEKLKGGSGDGNNDITKHPQFRELQKQMKGVQRAFESQKTELETERKEKADTKRKMQVSTMRSGLLEALGEKVYGPDLLVDNLITSGKVKLDDDDKTILFVNGEDTVDFKDGIEKLLEDRKDIVKNTQQSGDGSGGAGGDNTGGKEETDAERVKRLRKRSSLGVASF